MAALLFMALVFVVSFAIGYLLISKVPPLLHTPLMSLTNAISAVTILGALLLFERESSAAVLALGGVALATAAFNLVGGYAITHRMLRMFRRGTAERTA
jgi:NAD(P) transhydrogenase subunit alpha